MDHYPKLLQSLPPTDQVWRDALDLYGDTPLADRAAAVRFECHYRQAVEALRAVVGPEPDEEEEDTVEIETGEPVGAA